MDDGDITEATKAKKDVNEDDSGKEATAGNSQQSVWSRGDGSQRPLRKVNLYHLSCLLWQFLVWNSVYGFILILSKGL